METSGQHPQDSTSAGSPRLYPPLPVSTDGKGEGNTRIRQRLCSAKEEGERTPLQMPLRELHQPLGQDACGYYHQPPVACYYQPFSSRDILNGQRHTPLYLGETQAMIRLLETIFQAHRPTWDDIIQLLVSLFSTAERHRVLIKARKWFREMAPEGIANPQWRENQPPPMRGPIGTVTPRKGGATWRYQVISPRGGPKKL